MKLKAPTSCPVCGAAYETTLLTCTQCKSQLSGNFAGCDFCKLSDEDSAFLLTFIKCRGNIKDVEKALGISYPTVRGKLNALIQNLNLVETENKAKQSENRNDILERLSRGEISADEAADLLKNT